VLVEEPADFIAEFLVFGLLKRPRGMASKTCSPASTGAGAKLALDAHGVGVPDDSNVGGRPVGSANGRRCSRPRGSDATTVRSFSCSRSRAGERRLGGIGRATAADMSSQAEVRRLAREVLAAYPGLDVLIVNVGGFWATRRVTQTGWNTPSPSTHLAGCLEQGAAASIYPAS
jgi:NAD(P)-dependent dehydrogenase (short-subunit alcohol dehydrogenase family)